MAPIIEVQHLSVDFRDSSASTRVVNDVSFALHRKSMLAIVGESGSGKTTMCRALTRLFHRSASATITGNVIFGGANLLQSTDEVLRDVRRKRIRYVFQEPHQAMNPVLTIRRQMKFAASQPAISDHDLIDALDLVGVKNAPEVLNSYPHQLSVGIAQRVQLAMAILPAPELLIADEPTSAVDATLRFHLLDLLRELQQGITTAMIIVTHDLDVAREYAHEVAILDKGRLVEHTPSSLFFRNPRSEYGKMLLQAAGRSY